MFVNNMKALCFFNYKCQFNTYVVRYFTKSAHPFKILLTKKSVVESFKTSAIYNDGNIAVFNKPAGVAKTRSEDITDVSTTVYMDDVMKHANEFLPDFPSPTVVKFPEKYSSGILIIAANEEVAKKVEKCKRRAKDMNSSFDKYLVICQGRPIHRFADYHLAVRLASKKDSHRRVRVLEETWHNNEVKRQDVKIFRVAHKVIKNGEFASLCSVSLSTPKKNSLRLYFATKLLSPILGDIKFSSRVRDVLGVPMLLDPFTDAANDSNKRLPVPLLKALNLNPNDTSIVPQFIHLAQVTLPRYKKKDDLVLSAPAPSTFIWVCQQLGIYDEALECFASETSVASNARS